MALSRLPEPSLVPEQILDCIGAIALGIAQSQSLNTILNTAVEEVRKILQTDQVLIYRFQPDGSGVVVVESVGSNWTSISFCKGTILSCPYLCSMSLKIAITAQPKFRE